jgi:hypothetical protein
LYCYDASQEFGQKVCDELNRLYEEGAWKLKQIVTFPNDTHAMLVICEREKK